MEHDYVIEALTAEIQGLKSKLAVGTLEENDRDIAEQLFLEQQDEIAVLSVELAAVKKSRDDFQHENMQLKRRISFLEKKLKG